jgi:transcriptional regulator with XRE-family HTH domain
VIDLLRDLMGDDTQVQFARRVGIDQPELSKLLRGERRPARRLIVGLLRAFPDRKDDIVAALTAEAPGSTAQSLPAPKEVANTP